MNTNNKVSKWCYSNKEKKKTKIIGYEENNNKLFPIIECSKRDDIEFGMKFYCVFCKKYHLHGDREGHRVSHCLNDKSLFKENGYILKLEKKK